MIEGRAHRFTFILLLPGLNLDDISTTKVLYGADNQSFGNLRTALRKGEAKDGPVVLVLERPKKLNGDTR